MYKEGKKSPLAQSVTRVQALHEFENSDLSAARNEYLFRPPVSDVALMRLMRDERDMPSVYLQLNILMLLVPAACAVYAVFLWATAAWVKQLVGLAYFLLLATQFEERYILMLHYSAHRKVYKDEYGYLNDLLNWVSCPLFGFPGGVYFLHHVVMHHIENNHGFDISATEPYRRDSVLHFLIYWARFTLLIAFEVPWYGLRTGRYSWAGTVLCSIVIWVTGIVLLASKVSFGATMWVFVGTYFFTMLALAFGNWSQHIFVDPARPSSNYNLTYNCIDVPSNQTTFNDGYHVVHHVVARLHWTELPGYFHQNLDKFATNGALTFRQIHFFDVGILVLTGQLRKLVERHYVHISKRSRGIAVEKPEEDDLPPTVDEVVAILKERLRPVPPYGDGKSRGAAKAA